MWKFRIKRGTGGGREVNSWRKPARRRTALGGTRMHEDGANGTVVRKRVQRRAAAGCVIVGQVVRVKSKDMS